jgi:hypothetical protein
MIVARQFIAWNPRENGNPSRRGRYDWVRSACHDQDDESTAGKGQTVPYGTDSLLNAIQAINCLATFIQSLRDKIRSTRQL